jgi:hypothetical protein
MIPQTHVQSAIPSNQYSHTPLSAGQGTGGRAADKSALLPSPDISFCGSGLTFSVNSDVICAICGYLDAPNALRL